MATNDIKAELNLALTEYVQDVQRAAEAEAKEAANLTAKDLKVSSPKRKAGKGKGKYARGWKVKKMYDAGLVSYVVYNGNNPGLTHTLEHGHVVKNQFGTYGRAKAIPHIEPAAEEGIRIFVNGVKKRLGR